MNLPIPSVSVTGGPQWATSINSCLTIIDQHDHTPGNGVLITPDGMDVSSDLTFQSNNATLLRSVRFAPQLSPIALPADLGCLYESGVDLYFNDGNGNQIQITQSGGVAGSPGSIGSLTSPASASYNAGSTKFVWLSDSGKFASMESGALIVHETNAAATNSVTLQSPTALAASYTLSLPAALPASTQYVTSSSAGALSFSSADTIASAMTSTGANTIATTRTRSTGTTVGVGGVAISNSSSNFTSGSSSYVDVTNLTVTITTSGRPVFVGLIQDGSIFTSNLQSYNAAGTSNTTTFKIVRDSTDISISLLNSQSVGSTTSGLTVPPSALYSIDAVGAGTYVYKVQGKITSGASFAVQYAKLVAYEL